MKVNLGLLWGHLPRGIIRCNRNIAARSEHSVPFVLSRNQNTGREVTSIFNSFGNFHLSTSSGPVPVSLVEIQTNHPRSIHLEDANLLHAISLGFPVVGDLKYTMAEKFYNPVVFPPMDPLPLLLQPWYEIRGAEKELVESDDLSSRLLDGPPIRLCPTQSLIHATLTGEPTHFPGENSYCRYTDHPEAVHVRRDRG